MNNLSFFAHLTGVPHHAEEVQSVAALWPLFLLALEITWIVIRQRVALLKRTAALALCSVTLFATLFAAEVTTLRDASGRVLGYITKTSAGLLELRNPAQHFVGSYNPKTNETRDAAGRLIGTGNLLATLVSNRNNSK